MTDTVSSPARVGSLPATDSQLGLLLLDRQIPVPHLYDLIYRIELGTPYDPTLLESALRQVARIQPALRTVFRESPALHATIDQYLPDAAFPFEHHKLTDEDQVQRAATEIGASAYDMYEGPLYRFAYFYAEDRAVLIFGIHHVIFDHYSLKPFLQDLDRMLTDPPGPAEMAELEASRDKLYVSELAAQEQQAQSEVTARQAAELADALRDSAPSPLYPHPAAPTDTRFESTRLTWAISGAEATAIRSACQQHDVTLYEFFMTAFSATVGRHSAADDVNIGNVFFGRRTAGALSLAGFFVNTLPVRVRLDWTVPFNEFAATTVRRTIEFTRKRGKVAFNTLVEQLNPDRVGNRNPVFNCMVALYDQPRWPDAIRTVEPLWNGTAKFDLWLGVTPAADGWQLALDYDRELIPASVAAGLQASLRTAFRHAAADRAVALGGLFEDASVRESVRTDGVLADSAAAPLARWIKGATTRYRDRVAIEQADSTITYAQLDDSATRLAASLRCLGVRKGDVVGLDVDNLADAVTAILALMYAGAAYLPLDRSLPAARLAYMASKAACRLVIGSVCLPGVRTVSVAELDVPSSDRAEVAESAASYVMFTSGSSGQPKGVHMAERALRNLTAWQLAALGMNPDTRFLQYAPLGFDVSFQEIIPTLCAGGTVVSRTPAGRQDFALLARRIRDAGVTHVYLPVAALRPFAQSVADAGLTLHSLTHVCVSGEQLVIDDDIRKFFSSHPRSLLVNLYGPTETHAVTTYRFTAPTCEWPDYAPIGEPMTGVAAYVIDVTGHLAPTGVPGELHLGGECPALGYINDPERTTEAFLENRFFGGIIYRTGDHVMRDEMGKLIFLGRKDGQIKVRGFRVELGEIEAAARALPGVRNAVAAPRGTGARTEIVLFAVSGDLSTEQLRGALRAELPDYLVPSRVILVDLIPSTANGKVDRAALLRNAESILADDAENAVQYASSLERELAEMWGELLGIAQLDPHRSVLEYGAHSLMMFNSVRQVNKRYGIELTIADMFGALAVVDLARRVEELRRS